MEKALTKITSIEKTEFGTISVRCSESVDLSNPQTLLANRGVNTFVIFLRGLQDDKLEQYKIALIDKEIEIVFHDFGINELSPSYSSLTWVDEDGETHTITKVRAASANIDETDEGLKQLALNSLNARVNAGAELKK